MTNETHISSEVEDNPEKSLLQRLRASTLALHLLEHRKFQSRQ